MPTLSRRPAPFRHAALALALLLPLAAVPREKEPARERAAPAAAATVSFEVDAGRAGAPYAVDFIGNATRLDTLLGLRDPQALAAAVAGRSGPSKDFFRTRYPHFTSFRVGNVFVGYRCTASQFDELVERGPDGRLAYRFEQTLDMLQLMLDAGIKPHLALTGTPLALVPRGEEPVRHRSYGCVNAPPMDLSKGPVRERMPEWWALQDQFVQALFKRFGADEVRTWSFATWTEPLNPQRKLAHLVLPEAVVRAGRHDEGVATVLATSIDVAMKHGLRIRLGNLAGPVRKEYPEIVSEIARLPRGKAYLDHIDGYAVSRYRTRAGADIGRQLDDALALLSDPAMPAKGLFIDEFGDLAGLDGNEPFPAATGLEGARFTATVLARVFGRMDGSARSPRGVAFWRDQIEPRARHVFTQPEAYLKSASSHVVDLFAGLRGMAALPVRGPEHRAVAASRDGRVRVLLLPESVGPEGDAPVPQQRALKLRGLRPGIEYELILTEVSRVNGNPISAFLDGSPSALRDARGRFRAEGGQLELAGRWEACYYDEDAGCAWRAKARAIEAPLVRSSRLRADRDGALSTTMVVDEAGVVMVEARPL